MQHGVPLNRQLLLQELESAPCRRWMIWSHTVVLPAEQRDAKERFREHEQRRRLAAHVRLAAAALPGPACCSPLAVPPATPMMKGLQGSSGEHRLSRNRRGSSGGGRCRRQRRQAAGSQKAPQPPSAHSVRCPRPALRCGDPPSLLSGSRPLPRRRLEERPAWMMSLLTSPELPALPSSPLGHMNAIKRGPVPAQAPRRNYRSPKSVCRSPPTRPCYAGGCGIEGRVVGRAGGASALSSSRGGHRRRCAQRRRRHEAVTCNA